MLLAVISSFDIAPDNRTGRKPGETQNNSAGFSRIRVKKPSGTQKRSLNWGDQGVCTRDTPESEPGISKRDPQGSFDAKCVSPEIIAFGGSIIWLEKDSCWAFRFLFNVSQEPPIIHYFLLIATSLIENVRYLPTSLWFSSRVIVERVTLIVFIIIALYLYIHNESSDVKHVWWSESSGCRW